MPASRVPSGNSKGNGSFGTYPHSFEHGKPDVIAVNAVNAAGRRFTSKSDS
jgi:hypothetical protein